MSNQYSAWLRCCWRMVEVASGRRECHWRAGATGIYWSRNAGTAHARLAQARHPGDAGTRPRNETGPAECANYCVCAVAATARVRHFARPIAGTTVPWAMVHATVKSPPIGACARKTAVRSLAKSFVGPLDFASLLITSTAHFPRTHPQPSSGLVIHNSPK
jgi:hypothetical protein